LNGEDLSFIHIKLIQSVYENDHMITDLTTSVLKRYHSGKHFSEFYLQDGGKKQLA